MVITMGMRRLLDFPFWSVGYGGLIRHFYLMGADGISGVSMQAPPPLHEQPGTELGPRARRYSRYLAGVGAVV